MNTDRLPRDRRILCAVSGGADSMYLLCRLLEEGYDAAAAHYNHGLRGAEADRDEAFVRDFCRERSIPFLSEKGDAAAWAAEHHLSTEEAARQLRYGFLERAADELGAAVIATAHTADDNAETVLMNLTRGTGLLGLCGIPPVRGRIVRPLLDETHARAAAYLAARGIGHVEDSTNAEDVYTRNRIRHRVVPVLEQINPAFSDAVQTMTATLTEDETFLSGLAEDFIRTRAEGNTLPVEAFSELPAPVAARVVRRMAGSGLSAGHVDAIRRLARSGGFADVPGMRVGSGGGRLVFGVPVCGPLPERPLEDGMCLPEPGWTVRCEKLALCPEDVHRAFNIFFFKCENICGKITIASRKEGDRFRPAGRNCTKTLKQLFSEANIPPWERDSVPVLRDDRGIIGVYSIGTAERVCARAGDRDILKVQFIRPETGEGGCGYESGY